MDNGDWAKFQTLLQTSVKPLQDAVTVLQREVKSFRRELKNDIKELPCGDHTVKLTQIETTHSDEQRHKDDTHTIQKDSKDFVFKVLTIGGSAFLGIMAILAFLYKIGFFKTLAK